MPTKQAISLQDQDHLFGELIKHTNNAVIVTDLNGSIEYCNSGFTKITGYTLNEVKGKKPGTFLQGEETDPETVRRISDTLARKERVNESILNYHKNGSTYWLQLDIYPIYDAEGDHTHFMAIESLITGFKEKEQLADQRKQRLDENISYAKKLQYALFRHDTMEKKFFEEYFILDLPKDEVGGDFYIFDEIQNKKIVFLGDCTGHGASGAILTALCTSTVKSYLQKYKTLSPAMIIEKSQETVKELLENDTEELIRDNMEATLLFIDEKRKEVKFATTCQELYYVGEDATKKIKPEKQKVNDHYEIKDQSFTYESGAMVYASSDGFKDQFGSDTGKKYGSKRLLDKLTTICERKGSDQKSDLEKEFKKWQGSSEGQTDDVLIIGIQLK